MLRQILLAAGTLWACVPIAAAQETKSLRVYFIGNSVTDTINYRGLAELAKSRGYDQIWGRHMIPGAPLQWIWDHPTDGFQEQPFGHYPKALTGHQWDVLCLQPFDRHLEGKDGDLTMAKNFIDLALPMSPELQVYVYARWPRQGKDDFDTAWLKKYTGGWDGTNESRDYFERLTLELRKACPRLKKPILMIPVGHVMYELNQRMKAGEVPGHTHIQQVFADGIHLNNVGSYIVGCTFFATLYWENPKGLPSEPYEVSDRRLAEVIQDTVWSLVRTHELAGVAKARTAKNENNVMTVDVVLEEVDLAANTISARATTYLVPPHGQVGGAVFSMGTLDTPDKDKATRLVRLPVMPEANIREKGLQTAAHAILHLAVSQQGALMVVGIDKFSGPERIGMDWLDASRTKDKEE